MLETMPCHGEKSGESADCCDSNQEGSSGSSCCSQGLCSMQSSCSFFGQSYAKSGNAYALVVKVMDHSSQVRPWYLSGVKSLGFYSPLLRPPIVA